MFSRNCQATVCSSLWRGWLLSHKWSHPMPWPYHYAQRPQMVNIKCFDSLWPICTLLDLFQTKLTFLPQRHEMHLGQSAVEQKIKICLKWSTKVQIGQNDPIWDPFGPHWDISKPHQRRVAMSEIASNQLRICQRISCVWWTPKVSISIAMTTKKGKDKAQH